MPPHPRLVNGLRSVQYGQGGINPIDHPSISLCRNARLAACVGICIGCIGGWTYGLETYVQAPLSHLLVVSILGGVLGALAFPIGLSVLVIACRISLFFFKLAVALAIMIVVLTRLL